jgi:hypothetical protein
MRYQNLSSSLEAENPREKHGVKIQYPSHTKLAGIAETVR